jgi:hypothetical protein
MDVKQKDLLLLLLDPHSLSRLGTEGKMKYVDLTRKLVLLAQMKEAVMYPTVILAVE